MPPESRPRSFSCFFAQSSSARLPGCPFHLSLLCVLLATHPRGSFLNQGTTHLKLHLFPPFWAMADLHHGVAPGAGRTTRFLSDGGVLHVPALGRVSPAGSSRFGRGGSRGLQHRSEGSLGTRGYRGRGAARTGAPGGARWVGPGGGGRAAAPSTPGLSTRVGWPPGLSDATWGPNAGQGGRGGSRGAGCARRGRPALLS